MKTDNPQSRTTKESLPRISLVLPFESKMNKQDELFDLLTSEADKIEKELLRKYSQEKTLPLMKKLRRLIANIHSANNKSIGIFVSTALEKVYYFTPTPELYKKFPPVLKVSDNLN